MVFLIVGLSHEYKSTQDLKQLFVWSKIIEHSLFGRYYTRCLLFLSRYYYPHFVDKDKTQTDHLINLRSPASIWTNTGHFYLIISFTEF